MYKLRDYQQEAVEKGVEFFNSHSKNNGLIVMPTGSGKSLLVANIAKEIEGNVLVFQPNKEILAQNYEKYVSYGEEASIYSASMGSKEVGKVTFATVGSVKNEKELFDSFQWIIVDEAHLVNAKGGMYRDFIRHNGGKVLGLTASPVRLASDRYRGAILKFLTRTRPRIFDKVLYVTQIEELVKKGFWSPIFYYYGEFKSHQLVLNKTGTGYTDRSIIQLYKKMDFKRRVLKSVEKLQEMGRKSILVFTQFVEEAEYLSLNLGNEAAVVSAETPAKERDQIVSDFKKGRISVVSNVGVLTHGFDYPELDTVVVARPTRSLVLYYQMLGRGVRPHPDKEKLVVLDMCENYKRFGKIEHLRLEKTRNDLWFFSSVVKGERKQLTNIYFR